MSFRRKLKYLLVHNLKISNSDVQNLIHQGEVEVNGQIIKENISTSSVDEIKLKGRIIQKSKPLVYLKYYKPIGFESSLNPSVNNNLSGFFEKYDDLSIAGRLDKQSQGLLLLSNDGKWVKKICHPDHKKEKEYLVELDKVPDSSFFEAFRHGIDIGSHITLPCECYGLEGTKIKIILKEGKNRQIRRMCAKLNYQVISLLRTRIDQFSIENLESGMMDLIKVNNYML